MKPSAVPVLVKALDDKIGVRRGAAAVALCRRGAGENLAAVKKLFKDPDMDVRLCTALGRLTAAHDKDAVPVLIGLLTNCRRIAFGKPRKCSPHGRRQGAVRVGRRRRRRPREGRTRRGPPGGPTTTTPSIWPNSI